MLFCFAFFFFFFFFIILISLFYLKWCFIHVSLIQPLFLFWFAMKLLKVNTVGLSYLHVLHLQIENILKKFWKTKLVFAAYQGLYWIRMNGVIRRHTCYILLWFHRSSKSFSSVCYLSIVFLTSHSFTICIFGHTLFFVCLWNKKKSLFIKLIPKILLKSNY